MTGQGSSSKDLSASDQVIVVTVAANPEPHDFVHCFSEGQSSIVQSDSHRPQVANLLEV